MNPHEAILYLRARIEPKDQFRTNEAFDSIVAAVNKQARLASILASLYSVRLAVLDTQFRLNEDDLWNQAGHALMEKENAPVYEETSAETLICPVCGVEGMHGCLGAEHKK